MSARYPVLGVEAIKDMSNEKRNECRLHCAAGSMSYVHSESEGQNVGKGGSRDVWCDLRGGMTRMDR